MMYPNTAGITEPYVAGIIDGEGCIGLYKNKDSRVQGSWNIIKRVVIANTDKTLIKDLKGVVAGSAISCSLRSSNGHKPLYHLVLQDGQLICNLLKPILPYLRIKKEQAKLMIEFCESRMYHMEEARIHKKRYKKEYTQREFEIFEKFKTLNSKKGVRKET